MIKLNDYLELMKNQYKKENIDTEVLVVDEAMLSDLSLPDGIEEQEEILARQQSNSVNNKRIAKNTMLLYFRMMLTMGVSLYTSRVVLEVLGVEDFGIYNVVGGVVVMFSFLNSAMSSATQRYLSFELGRGNYKELKKIFNITVNIHFLIAFVIVLLAETLGLWFLNAKLNIPESRMVAANWVYQFSIATFFMTVISVPYNAAIISHERMNIYAYVSIFEVLAKLGVVYLIKILGGDKLAIYAGLLFVVATIVRIIYGFYCSRNFKECHYSWVWDKDKYKELLNYAGWNLWGNFAGVLMDQGLNMLLNVFFGPIVNAARGIAYQVNAAITSFVSNFQLALNPQIVKSYASDRKDYMQKLIFQGSRLSFYMLLILMLPVIFQTRLLMSWWLKDVPEYTVLFTQLVLINALINSLSGTLMTAAQATGKIKVYQSVVGGILLLNVPISYLLLKSGFDSDIVFYVLIVVSIVATFFRLLILERLNVLTVMSFLRYVVMRTVIVSLFVVCIIYYLLPYVQLQGVIQFIVHSILIVLITGVTILFLGLNQDERSWLKQKVLKR